MQNYKKILNDGAPRAKPKSRRWQILGAEVQKLRDEGILVNLHYIPIYRQPYYRRKFNFNFSDFPNAEKYYREAISLPIFPGLQTQDIDKVINCLETRNGYQTIF